MLQRFLVLLLVAFSASSGDADELPENTSLIEMRSRVFDMRWDASRIRRDDHFIPIDRVEWVHALMKRDPDLKYTVIHVDTVPGPEGRYVWMPGIADDRFPISEGIPSVLKLEGYDARRRSLSRIGTIALIARDRDDHYIRCTFEDGDPGPSGCSITVSYPLDRDIRIKVRIYRRTDKPIDDFASIARKARLIVRCMLDVTDAVEDGTWEQRPYLTPEDACRVGYQPTIGGVVG